MRIIYEWYDAENFLEIVLSPKEIALLPERGIVKNFLVHDGRGVLNVFLRQENKDDATSEREKQIGNFGEH
jgi:hypothetical protein